MNFTDLYRFAASLPLERNMGFRTLAKKIETDHPHVGKIETWACDLDARISMGHMEYEVERTSPYEEPYDVAVIRFDRSLNRCWQRLVCAKEMMHIFDGRNARTNSREKFQSLLSELETAPVSADASDMFKAERNALWMALIVLCPENLRSSHLGGDDSDANILRIATEVKLPISAVRAIRRPYYTEVLERFTGEVP